MENTLFQKILLSAYRKDSFTWDDIRNEFKLDDKQSVHMNKQFTIDGYLNGTPLFERVGGDKFTLGVLGQKYAMDLVEMRHATESARKAQRQGNIATGIAIFSLLIAVIVGVLQIQSQIHGDVTSWCQLILSFFK